MSWRAAAAAAAGGDIAGTAGRTSGGDRGMEGDWAAASIGPPREAANRRSAHWRWRASAGGQEEPLRNGDPNPVRDGERGPIAPGARSRPDLSLVAGQIRVQCLEMCIFLSIECRCGCLMNSSLGCARTPTRGSTSVGNIITISPYATSSYVIVPQIWDPRVACAALAGP